MSPRSPKFDTIIPFHVKDESVVRYCLDGCRRNLNVNRIFILTDPKNEAIFTHEDRVTVIDENSFFPDLTIPSIQNFWIKKNPELTPITSKWLYQQLIKMGCAYTLPDLTNLYMVLDADTVFLRPVEMVRDGRALMCTSSEFHRPYFDMYRRLFGKDADRTYSFITHHQVIQKQLMVEMLQQIGSGDLDRWYWTILDRFDYSLHSGFSEYETYGHYLKQYHPTAFEIRPLKWRNMPGLPTERRLASLARKYDFVSFHSYQRKITLRSRLRMLMGR